MNKPSRVYSSFRDPAGGIYESDGRLVRKISPEYQKEYDLLKSSGLYSRLLFDGLIIPHQDIDLGLLAPDRISTISYPYEWCFGMLKDAALTTLKIQRASIEHGMELKDASAYNIQFHKGKMVLIDTLSIMEKELYSPWPAYGQFCRHFLGPLLLMSKVDVRLGQLSRIYLDGAPLDLVSKLLPFTFSPSINTHIRVHSKLIKKVHSNTRGRTYKVSNKSQVLILDSLYGMIDGLDSPSEKSGWIDYNECSYSKKAFDSKFNTVQGILQSLTRGTILDLGSNTGNFSRLANRYHFGVVSVDSSHGCVEAAYENKVKYPDLLPLLMDVTNPCTGVGWEGKERPPLQERVKPNLVLALALIHHLAISGALPLDYLVRYFRSWNCPILIEFIPKSDPQVQKLFPGGLDIFPNYTEEKFAEVFSSEFSIKSRFPIEDSVRVLYYLVPKGV